MEDQLDLQKVCQKLLSNQNFINALAQRIGTVCKSTDNSESLDQMIDQVSYLLEQLVEQKLANQMTILIDDNNRLLEQIKFNFDRKSHKVIEAASPGDTSFTEIHKIINEQKNKLLDKMGDSELEKSLTITCGYENLTQKIKQMQKKIKAMQDRYQTNFKSLWNVLSMTQSAVFDHIKQNKLQKVAKKNEQNRPPLPQKRTSFLSSLWNN